MRWIEKQTEPRALREWRARYQTDINYNYNLLRGDHAVIEAVTQSLLEEQGWLCAYTGIRIERDGCHIEHITPRNPPPGDPITRGLDVDYNNLLACYPAPDVGMISFGAKQKENWPSARERHLFVSPLDRSCEHRFRFNIRGNISPADGDPAAQKTIKQLRLDDPELTDLRRGAIKGELGPTSDLRLDKARRRLRQLEQQNTGRLQPFCFALKQALEKHIRRIENIRASVRRGRGAP